MVFASCHEAVSRSGIGPLRQMTEGADITLTVEIG